MEPLICPQCGGQITSYSPGQAFTTCQYCSTTFLIEPNKQKAPAPSEPVYESFQSASRPQVIIGVMAGVSVVFGFVIFIAIAGSNKSSRTTTRSTPYSTATPFHSPSPAATADPNLLEFGSEGTGDGLFKDANTIAVDKEGRIYVGDDSMRVQQFDASGNFLRVIQIPTKTNHYEHARTIDKIAAGDNGWLYVAVGGTILIYEEGSTEPDHTIHVAPSYIQDFALRSDGGMLVISNNDKIETLHIINKAKKVVKRIDGFHTKAANAEFSPRETGLYAIRLAVDGAGNIFSVYAFGDLGSYDLSYNEEELMIMRFTPEGKYVNKFVQSMSSVGIEVDNQSRIYVSDGGELINVYSNTGQLVGSVSGATGVNAFALDKDNNVYILLKDRVIKRAAIS